MRRGLRIAPDASGAVALLFALLLPVLLGAGAFALDAGGLYLQRRMLQGATDAAALAAAARPAEGAALVRRILDANGETDAAFTLLIGRYEADAAGGSTPRFVPDAAGSTVRVEARLSSQLHLARVFGLAAPAITTQADASLTPVASLAAGSRLASVDPVLLESIVKPVLGIDLGLTVLDYNNLGKARIDLDGLLRAAATLDATAPAAATTGDLIQRPLRIGALLQAMSGELARSNQPVAAALLLKAGTRLKSSPATASLAGLLSLDADTLRASPGEGGIGLDANLSVLGLLNALLGSAASERGTALSLNLPGIAAVELEMQVGDPFAVAKPLAVSSGMPSVQTAQVRVRLRLRTAGVLDLLNLRLDVPIELVVAGGTAEVVSMRCSSDPAAREVKVAARPGVAKLALGAWSGPLSSASITARPASADLLTAVIASVKAKGVAALAPAGDVILTFRGAEIGNGTTKTARSTGLLGGLTGRLVADTEIEVRVGVIGLPVLGLRDGVAAILAGLVKPIDDLLDAVLATVGVGLGEIDVRVDDLVCDQARIVG